MPRPHGWRECGPPPLTYTQVNPELFREKMAMEAGEASNKPPRVYRKPFAIDVLENRGEWQESSGSKFWLNHLLALWTQTGLLI